MKFLLLFILLSVIPLKAQTIKVLPCADSGASCVETLTAQAVANSDSIKLIDSTIKLARRKGWTQYIDVSAIDPITLSLQVVRNLLGGGERQKRKIEIKSFELAKQKETSVLRDSIFGQLIIREAAEKRLYDAANAKESHLRRVSLYETSYKFGDGDTATLLQFWQQTDVLTSAIDAARSDEANARRKLLFIVFPEFAETKQK